MNFFDFDHPIMRFLSRVCDLLILNVLFLFTCLPIITIGASLCSLYYVSMKLVQGEDGNVVKNYFHSFVENFRQSTILWLGCVGLIFVFGYDYLILSSQNTTLFQVLRIAFFIVVLLCALCFLYLWPITAHYICSLRQIVKNSFFLSIGFLPQSLLMLAVYGVLCYFSFRSSLVFGMVLTLSACLLFSLSAYLSSHFFLKAFQKSSKQK